MKDFSHYKKHVEIDMRSYSGNFHFNEQLKQEGTDININEQSTQKIDGVNTTIRAIVRNTGVENKEATEERSIMIGKEYSYKCGDYVEYLYDTYLTITCVDKDNPFFNTSKIKRTNYTLKWMVDNILYNIPCIISNQTKYTLGISSSTVITEGDSRYQILMSYNDFAKTIDEGQRFIFNGNAWRTTQVDSVSEVGLMSLLLGQDSINENDNLDIEIADYYENSYAITLSSNSESIVETGNYQISPIVTNNGVVVSNSTNITYTSSDETIATVDENGLITAISMGNATITCSIGSVSVDFNLIVTDKIVENIITYGVEWTSTGTILKIYVASTAECSKYINGVKQDDLIISYDIDSIGQSLVDTGKITITQSSNSSVQIRNKSVSSTTTFTINIKDSSDDTLIKSQVITLTGM